MEHKNITLKNISEGTSIVKLNYMPTSLKAGESKIFGVGTNDVFLFSETACEIVENITSDSKDEIISPATSQIKEEVKIETEDVKADAKTTEVKKTTPPRSRGRKKKTEVEEK